MANIFEAIPETLPVEVFESLAEGAGVKIERIVSRGHTTPADRWYDQEKNEWVLVLRGRAIIAFPEKPAVTLQEGDYLTIRAHEKHRVQWTDPGGETVWLAVHYQDG